MTPNDQIQYGSLIISILVLLSMIILFQNRKSARLFYVSMMTGWSLGIIYYVVILFFNDTIIKDFNFSASHLSAQLRFIQYLIFGTWFILDALDITIKDIKYRFEKIKSNKRINDSVMDWEGNNYE